MAHAADGKTLLEQGHYKQLRSLAQERLKKNPNDAEALYWMSGVYSSFGDFEHAVDSARRSVELQPNNSEFHCQLADTLGDRALQLGVMGGGVSLAREMKRELQTSVELDPKNVRCLRETMGFYATAPIFVGGGSKSKARDYLSQIYNVSQYEGYLAEAGLLQMEKKPLSEIEPPLRKAVQANPHYYRAMISLISLLASETVQRYADAEALCKQAIAVDPNRAAAYRYLAYVYAHQQRWADLDHTLSEAKAHVPDDLSPYYNAGLGLLDANADLGRAEKYFRTFLTQQEAEGAGPKQWEAHWKLGLVMERMGRRNDAANELRIATNLNPSEPLVKKDLKRVAG